MGIRVTAKCGAPVGHFPAISCLAPHPAEHASNTGRGSGVGHVVEIAGVPADQ